MFPPGTRVRLHTRLGECLGTVLTVLEDSIDGDHVHRVKPDNGEFGVLLLLGRSLGPAEADQPFVVQT